MMLKLQNLGIVISMLVIFTVVVSDSPAGILETMFDGGSRNFGAALDVTNLSGSPIPLTGEFESGFNGNYPGGPKPFPGLNFTIATLGLMVTQTTLLREDKTRQGLLVDVDCTTPLTTHATDSI